jgi:predicted NBD/HSP70 family sugar kinase
MRLPLDHLVSQRFQAQVMRSVNGIGLLNLLSEQGPISRAALAKVSHLSKPTVSSQIEALIQQGLVVELGQAKAGTRGGKKPTLLRFNPDAGRMFAAEIHPEQIRAVVTDIEGTILDRTAHPLNGDRSAGKVIGVLQRELERLINGHTGRGIQKLISIAAPGRVDAIRGVVLEAGNLFNWHEVPIRPRLEKAFGIPVFVDNNVKMATLGELHHGVGKSEKDIVVVRLDTGIGSGVVVQGRLIHGNHWAAGEVAHMVLDLGAATEDWCVRGYLESVVGEDRIFSQAENAKSGATSALDFLRNARRTTGEPALLRQRIVRHLGISIANLICAYDPAVVVLQGDLFGAVVVDLRAEIARTVPWEARITLSEISDAAVLLGTVVAARSRAYERIARLFDGRNTSTRGNAPLHAKT